MAQRKGYKMPKQHRNRISLAHKGKPKKYGRPADDVAFDSVYNDYRMKARGIRGLNFTLTREQFKIITQQNCFYCGTKPKNKWVYHKRCSKDGNYIYNGIDRVNNDIGYMIENCVPCCKKCNTAKSNFALDEFKIWIKQVYKNLFEVGE